MPSCAFSPSGLPMSIRISVSEDGAPWRVVSEGSWQRGAVVPLQLRGEEIPKAALRDLLRAADTTAPSGTSFATIDDNAYKLWFEHVTSRDDWEHALSL